MHKTESFTTVCPECGAQIHMENRPHEQQLLLCPHCEILLIVTNVQPLHVDWAFEEPNEANVPFNPYYPHWPSAWQ